MPSVTYTKKGHMEADVTLAAEPGETLLSLAQRHHVPLGFACGGNCACSTCHVYVRKGAGTLSAAAEPEEDILDMAFDVRPDSRLGCQAVLGSGDVTVEITDESYQAFLNEHRGDEAHSA